MRIKAITNLFEQICFDSSKASIHFFTFLVCLHRTVRMLTNYFLGIRINYQKLFE